MTTTTADVQQSAWDAKTYQQFGEKMLAIYQKIDQLREKEEIAAEAHRRAKEARLKAEAERDAAVKAFRRPLPLFDRPAEANGATPEAEPRVPPVPQVAAPVPLPAPPPSQDVAPKKRGPSPKKAAQAAADNAGPIEIGARVRRRKDDGRTGFVTGTKKEPDASPDNRFGQKVTEAYVKWELQPGEKKQGAGWWRVDDLVVIARAGPAEARAAAQARSPEDDPPKGTQPDLFRETEESAGIHAVPVCRECRAEGDVLAESGLCPACDEKFVARVKVPDTPKTVPANEVDAPRFPGLAEFVRGDPPPSAEPEGQDQAEFVPDWITEAQMRAAYVADRFPTKKGRGKKTQELPEVHPVQFLSRYWVVTEITGKSYRCLPLLGVASWTDHHPGIPLKDRPGDDGTHEGRLQRFTGVKVRVNGAEYAIDEAGYAVALQARPAEESGALPSLDESGEPAPGQPHCHRCQKAGEVATDPRVADDSDDLLPLDLVDVAVSEAMGLSVEDTPGLHVCAGCVDEMAEFEGKAKPRRKQKGAADA